MNKLTKRPFTLMEVMIAFILILFCLVPLIYPNLAIYKDQVRGNQKIALDHAVTLFYGDLLEQVHKRAIPYELLSQKEPTSLPISYAGIDPKAFPYKGTLTAKKIKDKGDGEKGAYIVSIVEFTYEFTRKDTKEKPLVFTYWVPIVKLKPPTEQPPEEPPKETPKP